MALHPPPTYDNKLAVITQPFKHALMGRRAFIVVSLFNNVGASAQSVVNTWQTNFNAQLAPFLDSQVTVEKPTINLGDGSAVPLQATATGAAVAGTITGAMPPPQIAVLIKKVTGHGGKKNRGRIYLPWFVNEADVDETGVIASSPLASMQTNATALKTALNTAGTWIQVSNKDLATDPTSGKKYVTALHNGFEVGQLIVESVVATQRRRLER